MNQISSTRQLHYDLLRIFASFMVVMLHVSAFYWDKIQPQTEQWMAEKVKSKSRKKPKKILSGGKVGGK